MTLLTLGKKVLIWLLVSLNLVLPGATNNTSLATPVASVAHSDLSDKLSLVLADERLHGAIAGISVRDSGTGDEIFSKNGATRLHPASNMKLLTGAAALEVLGEDYRFSTEIWTDGKVKGNTLNGNLYIKGKGDPTLGEADLTDFATEIKASGITEITGDLIADDSWYDDVRLSMDLNWNDEPYYTGAQVSALTLSSTAEFYTGTVLVDVRPSTKRGGQALISVKPDTGYVTIDNQTEMVGANEKRAISVERIHGTNEVIVTGTLPLKADRSEHLVAVWEPTLLVLSVLDHALQREEIKIHGQLKTARTPANATLLTSTESIPLKDILVPFMKLSNNGIGEMLTKEIGKVVHDEGSWEKGLSVIHETMEALGLNGDTILLRDGSGMSHKTVIPATELSQMLFTIQEKTWFPLFKETLPIGGDRDRIAGGSLRYRMTDEPVQRNVRAKTGTINGVSTLSGFVTTIDGTELIFSMMINNHLSTSIRDVEDALVMVLATHSFAEE